MKTITTIFCCETEEKRSRFLARLVPWTRYYAELDALRHAHPKANHHVSAFRYMDGDKRLVEGAKDDGEPSGCAGTPALKVLQGNDLVNCAVIITRYFGGIKLGTGGMARAYGAAAKAVVEASDPIAFHHQASTTLIAAFDRVSELERLLVGAHITDRRYTETGVEVDLRDDEEVIDRLISEWERLNY